MGYSLPGYSKPGYSQEGPDQAPTVLLFPVPAPGEFVSASPDPGRVTVTASAPTTELLGGPYARVLAVVLGTHAGERIFSMVAVDPIYAVPPSVGRYVTLLGLDSITLGQGGSGSTLVTRIQSLELATFTAIFDNADGFWSQLLATEYVLCLTLSLYEDLGDGVHIFRGRGEIQEIDLTRTTCTIRAGA